MLYFTRWKAAAIVLTALFICLFAVPNFLSEKMVQSWPKWAQRHVVLGLDLQGGSHILLEVDSNAVRKEKLEGLRDDVRRVLRDARAGYTGLVVRGNSVEVRIRDNSNFDQALTKLRELSLPLGGVLGGTGARSLDVTTEPGNLVRLTLTYPAIVERVRQSVEQSIQIIERRVNELGTVEPLIQRQGIDRILVQVPGLQDPTRLKELLGKTAKLDFRMVDTAIPAEQAMQGRVPPDDEILYSASQPKTPYLIEKRVVVSGADLTDAQPGFDQRTSEPIVSFRFNTSGARKFAQVTQESVGKPFAIILDNEVISAPVIREPILGGSGQISGSFTVQSANDLSILLRAGSAPARSRMERSLALWTVKLPEICPEPPRIGSRMTGAEITSLSRMIANGLPTLSCVTCANFRAPLVLKRNETIGSLVRWSKPGCASVRSAPETTTRFSIR